MSQIVEQTSLSWEKTAKSKFEAMLLRIPMFHRNIAVLVVTKKAEQNARERGSHFIEEADIILAFFSEVPMAFYSLMVRLLDEVGFNYHPFEPK